MRTDSGYIIEMLKIASREVSRLALDLVGYIILKGFLNLSRIFPFSGMPFCIIEIHVRVTARNGDKIHSQ